MRTLVVLGTTGLRGRALLAAHARDGQDLALRGLARSREQDPRIVQGDVRDLPAELLDGLGEHVVVHLAVHQTGGGYEETNVRALERLLARLDPRTCRGVVYASSASVYGPGPHLRVREDAPLRPATALARSRAQAEALLLAWGGRTGAGVILARTRFVLGPQDAGLLSLARRAVVPGRGDQRLSAIPVDELGRALLALARGLFEWPSREAVNLALEGTPALQDVLAALAPRPRSWLPLPRALLRLPLPERWRGPLDRLELVAQEQTLDVRRAIDEHGLTFLAGSSAHALERVREAVLATARPSLLRPAFAQEVIA